MKGKDQPRVINIEAGSRCFEIQVWCELLPWCSAVFPLKRNVGNGVQENEEDKEGSSRAIKVHRMGSVLGAVHCRGVRLRGQSNQGATHGCLVTSWKLEDAA